MPAFWNERDDAAGADRHFPAGAAGGQWVRGVYIPADKHDPRRRTSMFADVVRGILDLRREG